MPDLIKTEEIVRGSSDVPVKKKLKILNVKGDCRVPFLFFYKEKTWNPNYVT